MLRDIKVSDQYQKNLMACSEKVQYIHSFFSSQVLTFIVLKIFIINLFFLSLAHSNNESSDVKKDEPKYFLSDLNAFVPEKIDYLGELGAMWEEANLYWIAASVGFNIGTCILSQSPTCQQYLDLIGGVGGRDSETHTLFMPSFRWQWVNFPSQWSPMARVFVGALNSHQSNGVERFFIYGAGMGFSAFLHERADLRVELRIGYGEQVFGQLFFGVHIKMNQWVNYFAERLKDLGIGTYETIKDAVKK